MAEKTQRVLPAQDNVLVKLIPNLLSQHGRKHEDISFIPGLSVGHYVKLSGISVGNPAVIIDGKKVPLETILENNPGVIIITGDVKDPISATIAGIAAWSALHSILINTVVFLAVVGFSLFTALSKPRRPSFGNAPTTDSGLDQSSPTYGWEGIKTTANVGTPVPIVYGTHRVGGNIINRFVTSDGDKNYLNVLIALCEGEIEDLSDLYINDNPATNFSGIEEGEKLGTNSQTALEGFEDLHNLNSIDVNLNTLNAYHAFTTIDSDVEAFEVHILLPSGLSTTDETTGSSGSNSVGIKIQYRLVAGSWATAFDTTIDGQSRSAIRRIFRKDGLTPGQYEIKVTRTTEAPSGYSVSDMNWQYLDEIKMQDLVYPNTVLKKVKALATDQLSGGEPNFTILVKGKKVSVPAILDEEGGAAVAWEDYYWKSEDSTWRLIDGDDVLYWDGTTYEDRYSANPCWCIRDLLTSTRYGLGDYILDANIDDDLWLEMAKYADEKVADGNGGYEKRFQLDVVIDSYTKAIDAITQLLATFRGLIFFSEGIVKLRIDKPESPVQLFGMGNIIKGSLVQQWKSQKEVYNQVEIQFMDAEKNYQQELVTYIDEEALADGDVLRKQELRIFTTRVSQALREARHAVNMSKYINRSIQFSAGIDSVAVQAGDVIDLSHDVPQWGYSGRVLAGSTTTSIVLDRSVTILPATTYKLRIRLADDTLEERTVSTSPGTVSTLTVSSAFSSAPAAYDVYSFGVTSVVVKPFRVMGISRQNDSEAVIRAVEYNASVYDDSAPAIPTSNYSALTTTIPDVDDVTLEEGVVTALDGTIQNTIDVYFTRPQDAGYALDYQWAASKIYISDDSQVSWRLVGQTSGTRFTIRDVDAGKLYYVAVVTVCNSGLEDSVAGAPKASITTVGKTAVAGNVSGFAYQFIANQVKLYWNPNTDADILGYEIREANSNWGEETGLFFRGLQTELTFETDSRSPGTYYIKAFNTSLVYSTTAASVTPTNSAPSAISGVGADILFSTGRLYWSNSSDEDVEKYQIYKSETDAWAGEEVLYGESRGVNLAIAGKTPRSCEMLAVTSTTVFTCFGLIGLPDDYFNKDKVIITSGVNDGQTRIISDFNGTTGQITLASALSSLPAAGDKLVINDVAYFKVRAVDKFGAGTLSSAYEAVFTGITSDMLDDNAVSARHIYVDNLSAISADMGSINAGTITGATMQTASGGQRLMFNSSGLYGYNSDGDERLRISTDGSIRAVDVTLFDPNCDCNYSYLSAGAWYFHDSLGNSTPYPQRILQGQVAAGSTLVFCGWCCAPKITLGIKSITTYDYNYPDATQLFCIYYDTPVWFYTSSTCWGWCTTVHAELRKAAGVYSEVIQDINFATSAYTHADACGSRVRMKLRLWASSCVPTDSYCYGHLAYKIKYKCCSAGAWCECSYTYDQPHDSYTELNTTYDVCQDIYFGGASGCFEIQVTCTTLTWCSSSIPQTSAEVCIRSFCAGNVCSYGCARASGGGSASFNDSDSLCISIGGSNPSGVFCNILCADWGGSGSCSGSGGVTIGHSYNINGVSLGSPTTWIMPECYNGCNFTSLCICSWTCSIVYCSVFRGGAVAWTTPGGSGTSETYITAGCLIQCYYPTVSATSCEIKTLYGTRDCSGDLTVLDSAAVLDYLAVSYG